MQRAANGGAQDVQVVEHEHGRPATGQLVPEHGEELVDDGPAGAAEELEETPAERLGFLERQRDVLHQVHGMVVRGLDAHPGERAPVGFLPEPDRRRLAVAPRRGDEDDLGAPGVQEPLDQVVTGCHPLPERGTTTGVRRDPELSRIESVATPPCGHPTHCRKGFRRAQGTPGVNRRG
ncbi:MAG: hypothetical protein M5U14_20635 [Acidimicrobiia bacterium]|nr:hypothetical protein [Acidimicrobiia bacterium]